MSNSDIPYLLLCLLNALYENSFRQIVHRICGAHTDTQAQYRRPAQPSVNDMLCCVRCLMIRLFMDWSGFNAVMFHCYICFCFCHEYSVSPLPLLHHIHIHKHKQNQFYASSVHAPYSIFVRYWFGSFVSSYVCVIRASSSQQNDWWFPSAIIIRSYAGEILYEYGKCAWFASPRRNQKIPLESKMRGEEGKRLPILN